MRFLLLVLAQQSPNILVLNGYSKIFVLKTNTNFTLPKLSKNVRIGFLIDLMEFSFCLAFFVLFFSVSIKYFPMKHFVVRLKTL